MGFLDFLKKEKPAPAFAPSGVGRPFVPDVPLDKPPLPPQELFPVNSSSADSSFLPSPPMPPPSSSASPSSSPSPSAYSSSSYPSSSSPSLASSLPQDPANIDWNALANPSGASVVSKQQTVEAPQNYSAQASAVSSPAAQQPVLPAAQPKASAAVVKEDPFKAMPLPPPSMQEPGFLSSKDATTLSQSSSRQSVAAPPSSSDVSQSLGSSTKSTASTQVSLAPSIQNITLPDFSEEDLALLSTPVVDQHAPANATPSKSALPSLPSLPDATRSSPGGMTITTRQPLVAAPANALAMPSESVKLPTGEYVEADKIQAAKFISSRSHFLILEEMRATRKTLRQNDEVIKDAILRHEQLDLQCKRVATDMNAIQEHFIRIDAALFEE